MKKKNKFSFFQASFSKGFIPPKLPIITVEHGDLKLNLLIDSGSDNNIIDSNILDKIDHKEAEYSNATHITGVGGTVEIQACSFSFKCNGEEYKADFLINDFSDAFTSILEASGIQLHGMLGTDFLQKNNIILDFQNFVAYNSVKLKDKSE